MLSRDAHTDWPWPLTVKAAERMDRMPLMRLVPYTLSLDLDPAPGPEGLSRQFWDEPPANGQGDTHREPAGVALSMNVSAGGMLVIMNGTPPPQQVLRVKVPTPVDGVETPTLAEARWSRKLPFPAPHSLYLVGLKFIV